MKKPRIWYRYNKNKYLVPERFIYEMHKSRGGGFEISVDFYTWAFNEYGISITGYETLYGNQDILTKFPKDKEEQATYKDEVASGVVFFAVKCIGRDKRGIVHTGCGEVGNESINNFQRGYPYGLATKRAKINMGKEFFELSNVKLAIDARDFIVNYGNYKGKNLTISEIYKRDVSFVEKLEDDTFNTFGQADNELLHTKAKEYISLVREYKELKQIPADDYICDFGKYKKERISLSQLYKNDKEYFFYLLNSDYNTQGLVKYELLKLKCRELLKSITSDNKEDNQK